MCLYIGQYSKLRVIQATYVRTLLRVRITSTNLLYEHHFQQNFVERHMVKYLNEKTYLRTSFGDMQAKSSSNGLCPIVHQLLDTA